VAVAEFEGWAMAAQKKNGTDEKDDVTSLSEVPAQADRLTVNFSGDALATIDKLVDELSGVDTRKAAVVKALELLYSARGKQILVRGPDGDTSILPVWTED
jgi:hypothetical protein